MTTEKLEELSDGANPSFMGLDCEQAITSLARRVIAAEKLVEALGGIERNLSDSAFYALTAYREASK